MKKLEAYKAFPIVAWVLILGFSYYVYFLAATVQDERNILSEKTGATQSALSNPTNI